MLRPSSLALVALVGLAPAAAEERLVLLGGGPRPREAMTRSVETRPGLGLLPGVIVDQPGRSDR